MSTSRDNKMNPKALSESGEEPTDPRLDALLDEAFSAKHVAVPKGMNDRILAAMAQAQKTAGTDADGNEGHVLASIGIVRWAWIGVAAAAVFAVSAFLLLEGTIQTSGGPVATGNGANVNVSAGQSTVDVAILESEMKRFNDLGNSQKDPLDRDLAALNSKIDELNKMWTPDRSTKSGQEKF